MALPAVKSLADCVDIEKTVYAFGQQLSDLPQQLLLTLSNPKGLAILYVSTNPLVSAFAFSLALSPIFLVISEINRNYSQVDRCWSILPTIYNIHYAVYAHVTGLPTGRTDLLMLTSIIWSSRLTFNYWRKGGYQVGSEDYRWEILQKYIRGPLWFLFNVFFISLAQSVLLFCVTTPSYAILLTSRLEDSPNYVDMAFVGIMLSLVALTGVADQQQWSFYNAREEYRKTAKVPKGYKREDLDRGFNTTGLFQYSRHPNFAAEQSVWISLYLWACQLTETYINWTAIGPFLYLCLFQEYREYQKKVGMFVPGPSINWTREESKKPITVNGQFKPKKA